MSKNDFIIETINGINYLIKDNIKPMLDANACNYLIKRMNKYAELSKEVKE